VLVVNAVTNVLLHGYDNQPGSVILCANENGDLRVILTDTAPLFDPTRVPPPDIFLPLEDRPLGGLGVHMMRQLTDELVYRALDDGNELVFVKRGALTRTAA
jgi:serine/threonine-protein kinase RsbW